MTLSKSEDALKSINRLLNELTNDNFKLVSQKLINSLPDNEDVLNGTAELIHEQALEHPKSVKLYVKLCNTIQRSQIVVGNTVSLVYLSNVLCNY